MTREEQRTCYNCKYKTSSNHQMRCTKGDYWKRIHKAKIPCEDWEIDVRVKSGEEKENWNGYHGHCVVPKGTFQKIWEDEKEGDEK